MLICNFLLQQKWLYRNTQYVSLTSKSACKTLLCWISWKWIRNIRIAFLLNVTGAWMWESKDCFGQNGFETLLNPFLWKSETSFSAQRFASSNLMDNLLCSLLSFPVDAITLQSLRRIWKQSTSDEWNMTDTLSWFLLLTMSNKKQDSDLIHKTDLEQML